MSKARSAVLFVGLVLGVAVVDAAGQPDAPAAPTIADIRKDETDARAKAAAELAAFARFCSTSSGCDDARSAYEKAIALDPDDPDLKTELDKLKNRKGTPWPAAVVKISERKTKCLAKCAELIAPVVLAYAQSDHGDDLSRLVGLLHEIGAPTTSLDIAYFEPYRDWRSKKDVERLKAGWEQIDGAWVEPEKVATLDLAHHEWTNPWTISDEGHEVRTTLPLRTARQVLTRAASVRRAFLRYFAGEWDLEPPAAKLRVIVTPTRAEFDERIRTECPTAAPPPRDSAAYYADTPAAGNPCFVACEVLDARDHIVKVDFTGMRWEMEHEIAHQVAFEYSKHVKGHGRITRAALWAIEGLAEFAPYVDIANGAPCVTRPSWIPGHGKEIDSAFSWCRANPDKIPSIDEFIGMPRQKFLKGAAENFRIAATLEWFLLEGNARSRRAGFVKFLETVHQDRDESDSLSTCMPGVNLLAIDAEFRSFCQSIRLDEK